MGPPAQAPKWLAIFGCLSMALGPGLFLLNLLVVGDSINTIERFGAGAASTNILRGVIWGFALVGGLLFVSGVGLLLRQRWGRTLSFVFVALAFAAPLLSCVATVAVSGMASYEAAQRGNVGYGGGPTEVRFIAAVPAVAPAYGVLLLVFLNLASVRAWARRMPLAPARPTVVTPAGNGGTALAATTGAASTDIAQPTASPPVAPTPQLSIMALMSLVLAFLGCLLIPQIVSLVLGVLALRRIRRSHGMLTGRGLAIGGICVSSVFLLFVAAIVALSIVIAVVNQPAATLSEQWRIEGGPNALEEQPDGGDMGYGAASAGPGTIDQLAFTSDGELLVGFGNALYVWDAESGRERRRIDGFPHWGSFVVDGDVLRAVRRSDSGFLEVAEVDLQNGAIRTLPSTSWESVYPHGANLSPRGGRVAAVFDDNTLWAWDADTGEHICRWDVAGDPAEESTWRGSIQAMALSPDGRLALLGLSGEELVLVDVQRGAEIRRFVSSPDFAFSQPEMMQFLPDGKQALSVGTGVGASAILWDVETDQSPQQIRGHHWGTGLAALSHDGRFLVTGGMTAGEANYMVFQGTPRDYGGDLILWKTDGARELTTFYKKSTSRVTALALSPDGSRLAAAYNDGTLIVLDVER